MTIAQPLLAEDQYFNALPKEVREGFNRVRWYWRYDTPEKYQSSVKGYYRMISQVDHEIGLIRKALEKKGVVDNTVIIFMGDNGYFVGERQLAGKWLMYDNSLRVPMIVYDPRYRKHKNVASPVLNIDVPVTILDLASVPVPDHYQGQSLCDYYMKGRKPVTGKPFCLNIFGRRKKFLLPKQFVPTVGNIFDTALSMLLKSYMI